jgi:serine/threonine protein phosphatase PrpC
MAVEEATENLIELANSRGGEDNISVAVLTFGDEPDMELADRFVAPRVVAVPRALADTAHARRAMWIYTAILCIVQVALIVLVWNLVNG